ncbi:MAG TPA: glucan biosynthesis protein D [Burkholderiales bacterium]
MPNRRAFLRSAAALAAGPSLTGTTAFAQGADSRPFDFAWLKGQARLLAGKFYRPPADLAPPALANLTWDQHQAIRFRADHALWVDTPSAFRAHFFHLGRGFREPVRMFEVVNGRARRITYDPGMFDYQGSGIDPRTLPKTLDFAGFRLSFHTDWSVDIAAFLGASYFRAVGGEKQYGLSARGLAIDTGLNRPEEFPVFNNFWLERPAPNATHLVIYALMDSPSITGAYRFEIVPGDTLTMDIDAALYPRKPIERLGIAPLTSMYQYGENDRRVADDWRPEVHDSDGLALWTGAGERIWRPLVNPATLRVNSFFDDNPRGFGLLQRDRVFDHYQDDGVFYEKRPGVWIEPKPVSGQVWGKGAVQLVEIPTIDETFDNIVTYWNPAAKVVVGREMLFAYRLYWGAREPFPPASAQVVATRDGIGGVVGQKRSYFSWRFNVDFAGGMLASLSNNATVEAVVTASRGKIELVSARPQPQINGTRVLFDLHLTDESLEPVNLRAYLRLGEQPLSETWIYQWTPPPAAERKHWITG